uniref:Coatomer subunit delta n=1 Tax=Oryza barthii TaxID=65489 RepID=A0A0D3EVW6_9ORYZ
MARPATARASELTVACVVVLGSAPPFPRGSEVVLAASIISKSGKALVSRQFVDMSRIRIEGLLAAFPKLVGSGKQHTYVETENVRYVYQPIEALYLLLITNKQSNILEDLDTLRLLSKLIPEYAPSLDEEGVCKAAFELLFAFIEAISLGNKENVTVAQVKQYCEMESHEEKLHKLVMQSKINETKDVMRRKVTEIEKSKGNGRPSAPAPASASTKVPGGMKLSKAQKTNQFLESLKAEGEVILEDTQPSATQSRSSYIPPSDPITVTIEEKLNVTVKRDGGVSNFDIQGTLALQILNDTDGFIQLQIENQDVPGLNFKTHPNINKELFNSQQIVGAKDPNRPFPSGQNETPLVKWRIQELNESSLPLAVNCWPSVSGNETYVNIEYEASEMYDSRNSVLEWSIILVDQSNRSGSLEFTVPAADPSTFFPISVGFSASNTFSDLKVTAIRPLREGSPPKFSQRNRLVTYNYQVV